MYTAETTSADFTTVITSHRSIFIAMRRAEIEWRNGARAVIVKGKYANYEIERTPEGIYGRLRDTSHSEEVSANEAYWARLASAYSMPELKRGAVAWIAPASQEVKS